MTSKQGGVPVGATTWVLIADGSRARVFEHNRDARRLELIHDEDRPELRDREAMRYADRPGRVHERHGQVRHAMERPTSVHEQGREAFARELVARLRTGMGDDRFARLVIVAPPAMLGLLRGQLDDALRERIVGELDRDLTQLPIAQLGAHLSAWIRVDPRPDLH